MVTVQSLFAVLVVLGLVAGLAWLVRRGAFDALGRGPRPIAVETAVPLGERRSLVIVAVEGRRLLLGLTPGQISMVAELRSPQPFEDHLDRTSQGALPPDTPAPLGWFRSLLARSARLARYAVVANGQEFRVGGRITG